MERPTMDPAAAEVWSTVRAMNDAWTRGEPARLREFFHADMVAITPTDRKPLVGREACVAGWTHFTEVARIWRWSESEPRIRVFGDAAVVTYDYALSCVMAGRDVEMSGRDMLVFVKEGGRWWLVADQFSPHPA